MSKKIEKYNSKGVRSSYVSTVIGISLVLFMMGIVIGGILGIENIQRQAKESLQVDLFFKPSIPTATIQSISDELKTWKKFKEVKFVSPDGAINEFTGDESNTQEILSIFNGENPLPATIAFKPKAEYANKRGLEKIKKQLLTVYQDELDEVNYEEAAVKSVNLGFKQFVFLIGIISLLLIFVAIAMINNTIRLALYSKRFTIKTMQLVGATSKYIRRPFIFQAFLQGFISAIVGLSLLVTLFYALSNVLKSITIEYNLINFIILGSCIFFLGVTITIISTRIALNRFLKMKLDDLY
ncbi:MAG: cell division protein FtsX [Crocinitomicaceae bacterium]